MKILLTLLLLPIAQCCCAQFNDTTHYHLMATAAGSINKTEANTAYLLNNAVNLGVKQKSSYLNVSGAWVYGKQNSTLTNNDFSTTVFFDLYRTFPHFYYWGLANYNTSYSLKLGNQLLAGAGVAYNILDKDNARLNLSDGVLFDQSSLLTKVNYHTYRNSLRLQFHFAVRDVFTIDGGNFLQSSFSNGNDYIIRSNTILGIKLRKWISLTTTLAYNKMNITNSDNLIFTYGLTLDKFF
ncbi:uncharacterized protein DUF481 [Mucilaginibacter gracilis]|uniref:Uncharacterized protein DUF481 n=1 Tax=Mucilaginibacter gracilis TaxID=423350 RepID=A0A495J8T3_9SPHI|nr:DUF481 domain-containing protein [Mucilaginibacter gracilis]RKR84872.1 uncharacterized protein DUF481 [Mucilaginibacter gracilis]